MNHPLTHATRTEILQTLREQVRGLEGGGRFSNSDGTGSGPATNAVHSSGCAALDRRLPSGGLRRGTLVEWLAAAPASGTHALALVAAREACRAGGMLVILDRRRQFYPPAAAAWGIDLSRTLVVRANSAADERWAWDQALRCRGVAAVWGEVEQLDARAFRRWQLAAEQSGALGLLLRPAEVRGRPSWADVQLLVTLRGEQERRGAGENGKRGDWRWGAEIVRCRYGREGGTLELVWDEGTNTLQETPEEGGLNNETADPLPLAATLANPAAARRARGA